MKLGVIGTGPKKDNIHIALLAFWMLANFSFTKKAFTKGKKEGRNV